MSLLPLDDPRYKQYRSSYGIPFNVAPLLTRLKDHGPTELFWEELCQELYHQGDVGEASYAAVPYLVDYQIGLDEVEVQLIDLVVTIELAQYEPRNPTIPSELELSYAKAIRKVPYIAMEKLRRGCPSEAVMAVAAATAVSMGHTVLARSYLEFGRKEALQFLYDLEGFEPAAFDV